LKSNKIYLGLGSNLGNREESLSIARQLISQEVGAITSQSSIYETTAWGVTEQDAFLNQVIEIETRFLPNKVLNLILVIEKKMGRVREMKWGARTIDIDILYFANKIILTENLIIPHPFIQERRFVLVPLCEIVGDFIHPKLGKTNLELLDKCKDSGEIGLFH
jgi:2-amino-4-hydroxy-6-hydroxymethyldihydropteridine diphosphokinase